MSIPKIIHYCWFGGGQIPKEYDKYIRLWSKFNPDYKVIRWDETNCDIHINKYVKEAYQSKKYAFVSDYFRLKALYENGGIYLDTDVEVFKSFDSLLYNNFFIGYIWNCLIGTAVIGAEKNSTVIKEILNRYDVMEKLNISPNNHIFTDYFLEQDWFILNGKELDYNGIHIYPKEYFEVPPIIGKKYSEHHIANSWHDIKKRDNKARIIVKRIIPHNLWRQMGAYKALKQNRYYCIYKKDKDKLLDKKNEENSN